MNDQVAASAVGTAGEAGADLVLDELAALAGELGGANGRRASGPLEWPPIAMPDKDGERLLGCFRAELEKLADSVRRTPGEEERAVAAALDGAQLTIRSELITGRPEELPHLLPSLVYLVVLPIAGERQALCLAERLSARLSIASGRSPCS